MYSIVFSRKLKIGQLVPKQEKFQRIGCKLFCHKSCIFSALVLFLAMQQQSSLVYQVGRLDRFRTMRHTNVNEVRCRAQLIYYKVNAYNIGITAYLYNMAAAQLRGGKLMDKLDRRRTFGLDFRSFFPACGAPREVSHSGSYCSFSFIK